MSVWDETWEAVGFVVRKNDADIFAAMAEGYDRSDSERTDARARLAAAAPDLYRVVKALEWSASLTTIDENGNDDCERTCPVCTAPSHVEKHTSNCALAAALRKAEGK